jgi:hypothetical protein
MNPPKNTPESNKPSPQPTERVTRTHHTPSKPFIPAENPVPAAPATQKQSRENFSGHTPSQSFTNQANQQAQSNIIRGVSKTVFGDRVQGSHHIPKQEFTPKTPSKPASPPPTTPKKP